MSEELFSCGYGAILKCDAEVLEACLTELNLCNEPGYRFKLRVLEIGMHDGGTAKGIEQWLTDNGQELDYTGIDPDDGSTRPRYTPAKGEVIVGDSAEVFPQVQGEFDLVWIDGCHCGSHCVLDSIHYASRVRIGGFVCYHDTNPRIQSRADIGYQYHGPKEQPWFGIAVIEALRVFGYDGGEFSFGFGPSHRKFALTYAGEPKEEGRMDCGTLGFRRVA